jgi:hypothetical protein
MYKLKLAISTWALLLMASPAAAQSYSFVVEHQHALRGCRGTLVISPNRIEYKTDHVKDARAWQYADLQEIKIESPTSIELVSHEDQRLQLGRDRVFKFKLLEGEITPEVSALLTANSTRPTVTSVLPVNEGEPVFEIRVKHLHTLGGCEGMLRIYSDRVTYESRDRPSNSRYWRFTDIQNFSQPEPFRFEVTTFEDKFGGPKSYSFQLKGEMSAQVYDYIWARVYPSKFHSTKPARTNRDQCSGNSRLPSRRSCLLERGRVAFFGSPQEFLQSPLPAVQHMLHPVTQAIHGVSEVADPWRQNRSTGAMLA